MRYHFFRNFDDYSGFQPKTTFLYYSAHDCSHCCLCHYWISEIQGKPKLSENENYFVRKLRQEDSPESFAKERRHGSPSESFTRKLRQGSPSESFTRKLCQKATPESFARKLQKKATPESFAKKFRQFIMTNYSDALLRGINN